MDAWQTTQCVAKDATDIYRCVRNISHYGPHRTWGYSRQGPGPNYAFEYDGAEKYEIDITEFLEENGRW